MTARGRATPSVLIATGLVVGLTWAAALRGWMIQMTGYPWEFSWYGTFLLVLAPGAFVGAALGLAEHRRRVGEPSSAWLALSPCLLLLALADQSVMETLTSEWTAAGIVTVVVVGVAGGFAVSGSIRPARRRALGGMAVLGLLLLLVMASETISLQTPRGLWVGLYGASLAAVLGLACAFSHRVRPGSLVKTPPVALVAGGVCGFAWAAALREFMWEVAGFEAGVEWAGTFLWVLLPGTVIGALLALGEHQRWSGAVPIRRWLLVWSPMLFAAVLVHNPLDLLGGFEGGIGLAAVAVPAMCMLGGYAIAGRGPRIVRALCGLVTLSAIPLWSIVATDVGGSTMSLGNAHGAWAAVLYWTLLATFSMAAALPHRRPVSTSNRQPVLKV